MAYFQETEISPNALQSTEHTSHCEIQGPSVLLSASLIHS
jgi:hypothetical protein